MLEISTFARIRQSVELVCYLSKGFVTEEIVLFAIKVKPHKIHL